MNTYTVPKFPITAAEAKTLADNCELALQRTVAQIADIIRDSATKGLRTITIAHQVPGIAQHAKPTDAYANKKPDPPEFVIYVMSSLAHAGFNSHWQTYGTAYVPGANTFKSMMTEDEIASTPKVCNVGLRITW